jgi:nucleotide-binding universal stress UspA family protein
MKLVAGTDFSELADRAVEAAFGLAQRLGDSFEIVHVVEPPTVMVPELAIGGSELMVSLEHAAQRKLDSLVDRFTGRGIEVGWKLLSGFAEESLPSYATEQKARLLAIGTHGRKGAARLFIGSVAERIVRRVHVPVLVIPNAAHIEPADVESATRKPLRVVAGVEDSPASDAALAWLRTFAAATPCELSLVHVYWPLRELQRFGIEEVVDVHEGKEEVARLLARELRPRVDEALGGLPARLQLRPTLGRDADPLVHEAELSASDLLVVGTSQRHDRWGGSTAVAVVRSSKRPVICVPTVVEGVARPANRPHPLRTLLVPVDLSEDSRAAIAVAFQMLRGAGGVIELLHVVKPTAERLTAARAEELERHLGELVPVRDDHSIVARPHFVQSDSPADAILHAAERLTADAIVLASHTRRGLKHALGATVVEHVFKGTRKPVMVVPVGPG